MASSTKESLAAALKQMMTVKPIDKITVKDLVEICGVNRQTFYYHFDDVYDLLEWVFEEDANRVLPHKVVFEHWREDVMIFMKYLEENGSFTLNVYNSNSRVYMLRYLEEKMAACIRSFAVIASFTPSVPSALSRSGWIWGCSFRRRSPPSVSFM